MNKVIILAAGKGERMSGSTDKLFLTILGHPLLYYTILSFAENSEIESIIIVANRQNKIKIQKLVDKYRFRKVEKIVTGGTTRQKSLEKGFAALAKTYSVSPPGADTPKSARTQSVRLSRSTFIAPHDIILVHNGANPLPSGREISQSIAQAQKHGACIVGHPLTSTIKEISRSRVLKTHDRRKLFAAETPQAVRFNVLQKALAHCLKHKIKVTDESMMLEAIGQKVRFIEASSENFKITTEADLQKIKNILGDTTADFRVGIGQDSHMFDYRKKGLTLAGIKFPQEQKLQANSDGDVILHAIFNAISQAIGRKSLGFFADPLCKNGIHDSKKYLDVMLKKIRQKKFTLNTLGLMIEARHPQIDPISLKLKQSLADILRMPIVRIGITATSGEELSAFGQGLGIQCFAIVSLKAL